METRYDYKDKNGTYLYHVRKFYQDGKKKFRRERVVDGQLIRDWNGVLQVPYNLPALAKSKTGFFVEGEKDVDSLAKKGLVGTPIAGGANAWRSLLRKQPDFVETYFSHLESVLIIPDNDKAGSEFMEDTAKALHEPTNVITCTLDDLEDGGDISDWFDKNPDPKTLLDFIDENAAE